MNIKQIESKDNPKIKYLKKLLTKKYREEFAEFMVENFKIMKDVLKNGIKPINIFVTQEFIDKNFYEFEEYIKEANITEYFIVTKEVNKTFSSLSTPLGITGIYKEPEINIDYKSPIVYLNRISNPGNLGAILRSVLGFGFKNVVLDEFCVDLYNPKTIQASKDAFFKLNICFDRNKEELDIIKSKMQLFSTVATKGEGLSLLKDKKIFCIVFGNESNGIDADIIELSDGLVSLDISPELESLNVACAVSVILWSVQNILK